MQIVLGRAAAIADRRREAERHVGDAQPAGVAAAIDDVRLDDVDRLLHEQLLETIERAHALPGRDLQTGLAAEVGHAAGVVVRHRLFHKGKPVTRTHPHQPQRLRGVDLAIDVDRDLDAVADRVAHRLDAAGVFQQRLGHVGEFVGTVARDHADHHLHAAETLLHPMLRHRCKLVAVHRRKAHRDVARHLVARAAEQPPHRLLQRLAADVPERDVDRADGVIGEPGLPAVAELAVHRVPDVGDAARIHAEDQRRDGVGDQRGSALGRRQAGDAVADDAGIGLDLDEDDGPVDGAVDARRLDRHRRIEGVGGDALDLHEIPVDVPVMSVARGLFAFKFRPRRLRHSVITRWLLR